MTNQYPRQIQDISSSIFQSVAAGDDFPDSAQDAAGFAQAVQAIYSVPPVSCTQLTLKTGDLIRATGTREVDVLAAAPPDSACFRRHVPDPATLTAMTNQYPRQVQGIPAGDFQSVPVGPDIPGSAQDAAGFARAVQAIYSLPAVSCTPTGLKNGDLIQVTGGGAVDVLAAAPSFGPTATAMPTPPAQTVSVSFEHTGAPETWTAPPGVTRATFAVFGAQGGGAGSVAGGNGGWAVADLAVTPGAVYQINVGGRGGDGTSGYSNSGSFGGGAGGFNGGAGGAPATPTPAPTTPQAPAGAAGPRTCAPAVTPSPTAYWWPAAAAVRNSSCTGSGGNGGDGGRLGVNGVGSSDDADLGGGGPGQTVPGRGAGTGMIGTGAAGGLGDSNGCPGGGGAAAPPGGGGGGGGDYAGGGDGGGGGGGQRPRPAGHRLPDRRPGRARPGDRDLRGLPAGAHRHGHPDPGGHPHPAGHPHPDSGPPHSDGHGDHGLHRVAPGGHGHGDHGLHRDADGPGGGVRPPARARPGDARRHDRPVPPPGPVPLPGGLPERGGRDRRPRRRPGPQRLRPGPAADLRPPGRLLHAARPEDRRPDPGRRLGGDRRGGLRHPAGHRHAQRDRHGLGDEHPVPDGHTAADRDGDHHARAHATPTATFTATVTATPAGGVAARIIACTAQGSAYACTLEVTFGAALPIDTVWRVTLGGATFADPDGSTYPQVTAHPGCANKPNPSPYYPDGTYFDINVSTGGCAAGAQVTLVEAVAGAAGATITQTVAVPGLGMAQATSTLPAGAPATPTPTAGTATPTPARTATPPPAPTATPAPATPPGPATARDGQHLGLQPASVQAAFVAQHGDGAAARWVAEHEAALARTAP